MASVRKTPGGKFELCITHKILPKRIFLTFTVEAEAIQYGEQCDSLLRVGIVPAGLVEEKETGQDRLSIILLEWMNSGESAPSELVVLKLLLGEVGKLRIKDLSYTWAQSWVKDLKLIANLSPSSIRKRIGALSRCLDNHLRNHPDITISNPLKLLPRGSATYNARDAEQVALLGKLAKIDVVRDRRLKAGEQQKIIDVLNGVKRVDRQRPLEMKESESLKMIFTLILNTGIRLMEAYTLRLDQVNMEKRVINVKCSKQWYGRVKFRDVPMRRELHAALTGYLKASESANGDLLFPWLGDEVDEKSMKKVTAKLSSQFSRVFEYAMCDGLTEHDLRHEATCQWYEEREPSGQWMFREKEIEKIMGWAPGSKMASRYASFRAEDLAQRLWA